ncbi:MAG: hypothetical protein A3H32_15695 [Betaproteobacteria bacterium RIFCSPLOWO2_02_FULL_63_19]|nr:MAG: hypothetical protein A3H32_15695 [Betaproteobacteria bacterium RIFCSPLOWO2_02_FULL_63_19]
MIYKGTVDQLAGRQPALVSAIESEAMRRRASDRQTVATRARNARNPVAKVERAGPREVFARAKRGFA